MFAHIRKHQQWLFIVIIAVVIVSFVVFFTPSVGTGGGGGGGVGSDAVVGTIGNQPITQQEYYDAYKEVALQFFSMTGSWPDQMGAQYGFDPERETPNRLLMIRKLNELGIVTSDETVASWKVNFFADQETSTFQRELYDRFLDAIKPRGLTEADVDRYAAHQVGIGQLTSLVSMSGEMVTPSEAERAYKERNQQATTMALLFSRTNHMSAGQDLVGLEEYFTNNMAVYRVQEKRKIRYVKFAATNYLAEAETQLNASTNLQSMIDEIYTTRGTNSFTENGEVLPEEKAKEQIRQEELENKGLEIAEEATKKFMSGFAKFEAYSSGALEQLATEMGLESDVTTEFSGSQLAPGLGAPYSFTQTAYQLTEEEPIASPLETPDAFFVMALDEIIPDHPPTLDEVRARVMGDFRREKQLTAAREEANTFHESLKTAMEGGKSFEEACKELGQTPIEIPNFSLATRTLEGFQDRRVTVSWLQDLAFAMAPGEVSDVSETSDGAGILFLEDYAEVDEAKMNEDLPDFLEELRQTRRNETFSAWIEQQMASVRMATDSSEDGSTASN
jgi:parvulin-like peptidyl-prolyl isomerase